MQLIQTADGSCTLQNNRHSETYHSRFGAVTESLEVFIKNSGVLHRIQNKQHTRVLEIGFGTGLNFILTADLAETHQCNLDYEAIEYNLPPAVLIAEVLQQCKPLQVNLTEELVNMIDTDQVNCPAVLSQYTSLNLRLENAQTAVLTNASFDAIYLDAFSSKNNPDLWTKDYLYRLCNALTPEGILSTYSVNRAVKDALTSAGFNWKKHKGPPGKREVITAWQRKGFS